MLLDLYPWRGGPKADPRDTMLARSRYIVLDSMGRPVLVQAKARPMPLRGKGRVIVAQAIARPPTVPVRAGGRTLVFVARQA